LTGAPLDATGIPDVEWLTPEGRPFSAKDWNDPGTRTLLAVFYDRGEYDAVASRAAVLINAGEGTIVCLVEQPSREIRRTAPGATGHVLDALATAAGIAPQWFDVNGRRTKFPRTPNALCSMPSAFPLHRPGIAQERELRPFPAATTLRQSSAMKVRLGGRLAGLARCIGLIIALEDGSMRRVEIAASDGQRGEAIAAEGAGQRSATFRCQLCHSGGIGFGRRRRRSALPISLSFPTRRFCRKHCVEIPALLGSPRSFIGCGANLSMEWAIRVLAILPR
jgi:hypothetical protein